MGKDDRVHELLEELFSANRSPEEVCANDPELLDEVKRRWEECQQLQNDLGTLFPSADETKSSRSSGRRLAEPIDKLPEIDNYRIDGLLGRGGMGLVYKAFHLRLHRAVAIKMLLSGVYASRGEAARFLREARAIARLRHPHVVQVYDVGECGGQLFYAMEWVEGGSLADRLKGIPQPSKWAAEMTVLLADAVEAAHRAEIIHRDLKPANVLLTKDGSPKVSDFGLARRLDGDDMLTAAGGRIGTPSYMAPEQVSGSENSIGPAADVYGLGAILYEMLTGRPPFRGESIAETERQLLDTDPAVPSQLNARVPRDLDTICLKCLSKDPGRRYPSAAELAADLGRYLRSEPIHARPISWAESGTRWMRRHPGTAASLLAVASLLLLLVIGSLVITAHFRVLERQQRSLADEKGRLVDEKEVQRKKAVNAELQETDLRQKAEAVGGELRQNLYFAQMNLGAQAAMSPGGLGRVGEWLAPWAPNPDHSGPAAPDLRNWEWYYLDGLRHRDLKTLTGHSGGVRDVAFSPDGKRLASADTDANVYIWSLDGDRPVIQMHGDSWELRVAWSPDGHRLASSSHDGLIKIWNADTGEKIQTLRCSSGGIFALSWSPDGTRLVSGGHDGVVQVWNLKSANVKYVLRGHADAVRDVAWSPDGLRLASAGADSIVRTWDAVNGKPLLAMHGHVNWVNRVVWNRDGTRLASASNDGTVRVWDSVKGDSVLTIDGHSLGINSVAWSPDGARLATAGDDQTIRVCSASDGTELFRLRGHTRPLTSIAWSRDGMQIASSSFDKTVKLWSTAARAEVPLLAGHTGPINAVAWSPDSRHVASASMDHTIKVWDIAGAKEDFTLNGHTDVVRSVAWKPDGTRLASAGNDHTLRIWDSISGKQINAVHVDASETRCVAWSPDGGRIISGGSDFAVRIWDADRGKLVRSCIGHQAMVRSVCWSFDGKRIASGSDDASCKIWDAATGASVLSIDPQLGSINCVAWSSDGRWLATSHADWTIRIWDAATGKLRRSLLGHTAQVNGLAWSPDGTRLASVGDDHTIKLWDTLSGNEAVTLPCDANLLKSVAWSPNGLQLASGGDDYLVRIHDATPGYKDSASRR